MSYFYWNVTIIEMWVAHEFGSAELQLVPTGCPPGRLPAFGVLVPVYKNDNDDPTPAADWQSVHEMML